MFHLFFLSNGNHSHLLGSTVARRKLRIEEEERVVPVLIIGGTVHPSPRSGGGGQDEPVNGNPKWAASVSSLAPAGSDFWFQDNGKAAEA